MVCEAIIDFEENERNAQSGWNVKPSEFAHRMRNEIREIFEDKSVKPNPHKEVLSLALGDPTCNPQLQTHPVLVQAVSDAFLSGKYSGYTAAHGSSGCRAAIADKFDLGYNLDPDEDIMMVNGCSGSLEACILALGGKGKNILIPKPGFPLYRTLAREYDIDFKQYNLMPDKSWEINLDHLETLIDSNTVAILINNPSNPCGSVFSKEHCQEIAQIAERNKLPIIADEIYSALTYGRQFHFMAEMTSNVPILHCGGLAKNYLVPGYRLGWIICYDRLGYLNEIRSALRKLCQRLIHPCHPVMEALSTALPAIGNDWFKEKSKYIEKCAKAVYKGLKDVPGLKPIMPEGAMYMTVQLDLDSFYDISTSEDFFRKLYKEESVLTLPGEPFHMPGFIRLTMVLSDENVTKSCQRIQDFCSRHTTTTLKLRRNSSHLALTNRFEA